MKQNLVYIFILSIILLIVTSCSSNRTSNINNIDVKHYCQNSNECVDGEYCHVTEKGGCVSAKWWNENVGKNFDCLPDPSKCNCIENKCVKK
jgi:hypothetical protein